MSVYIAGPYQANTKEERDQNILNARSAMMDVIKAGGTPICPHTMTGFCDDHYPEVPDSEYLRVGLELLELCDRVYALPGWEKSAGTRAELHHAIDRGIPIMFLNREVK